MARGKVSDPWLRTGDIAAMFGLSHYAVIELMKQGKLPPHIHRFNGPCWKKSDVEAWITKLKKRHEGQV